MSMNAAGTLVNPNGMTTNYFGFVLKNQNQKVLANGYRKGNLYVLQKENLVALITTRSQVAPSIIWHSKLGHPNLKFLQELEKQNVISVSSELSKNTICGSCQLGKKCKLLLNKSQSTSKFPLNKIHSDLWRPTPTLSSKKIPILCDIC